MLAYPFENHLETARGQMTRIFFITGATIAIIISPSSADDKKKYSKDEIPAIFLNAIQISDIEKKQLRWARNKVYQEEAQVYAIIQTFAENVKEIAHKEEGKKIDENEFDINDMLRHAGLERGTPQEDAEAFLNRLRKSMLDPDAAKLQQVVIYESGPIRWICGEINGKNRYGAYTGYKSFFGLIGSNPNIQPDLTYSPTLSQIERTGGWYAAHNDLCGLPKNPSGELLIPIYRLQKQTN